MKESEILTKEAESYSPTFIRALCVLSAPLEIRTAFMSYVVSNSGVLRKQDFEQKVVEQYKKPYEGTSQEINPAMETTISLNAIRFLQTALSRTGVVTKRPYKYNVHPPEDQDAYNLDENTVRFLRVCYPKLMQKFPNLDLSFIKRGTKTAAEQPSLSNDTLFFLRIARALKGRPKKRDKADSSEVTLQKLGLTDVPYPAISDYIRNLTSPEFITRKPSDANTLILTPEAVEAAGAINFIEEQYRKFNPFASDSMPTRRGR